MDEADRKRFDEMARKAEALPAVIELFRQAKEREGETVAILDANRDLRTALQMYAEQKAGELYGLRGQVDLFVFAAEAICIYRAFEDKRKPDPGWIDGVRLGFDLGSIDKLLGEA